MHVTVHDDKKVQLDKIWGHETFRWVFQVLIIFKSFF